MTTLGEIKTMEKEMKVLDAAIFGKEKHRGQLDDEGEDYFEAHCCKVCQILELLGCDKEILIAGLLHDTLEYTDTIYEDLDINFGKRVADLVLEVTHQGEADEYGYYFPLLKSRDAILIKFADRLSNLSRMNGWSEKRRQQYLKKSKFWKE